MGQFHKFANKLSQSYIIGNWKSFESFAFS